MINLVRKVITEKHKAVCKVMGIFKVEHKSSSTTVITGNTEVPVVTINGDVIADDIIEDVTLDQISDLDEV